MRRRFGLGRLELDQPGQEPLVGGQHADMPTWHVLLGQIPNRRLSDARDSPKHLWVLLANHFLVGLAVHPLAGFFRDRNCHRKNPPMDNGHRYWSYRFETP